MAISMVTPKWISAVEDSYKQDPHCQKLLEQLLLSLTILFIKTFSKMVIRYKGKIYVGKDLLLRKRLMQALHSSAVGDHSGMKASYHRLKQIFYWPGMKNTWISLSPYAQCVKRTREKPALPWFS